MTRTKSYLLLRPLVLLTFAALTATVMMTVVLASPAHAASATITVTTAADEQTTNSQCSLRESMINANANDQSGSEDCVAGAGDDTIVFDQSLSGQPITLGSQLPAIADSEVLTIDGGSANGSANITVSGDKSYRVFEVGSGSRDSTAKLTLNKLTVADGSSAAFGFGGGGILNNYGGTLTVSNSTLSGNSTTNGSGGGIFNSQGTLTVSNSTLSANSATNLSGNGAGVSGGGIYNFAGTATVSNSTLSANSADSGGGIVNQGTLTVSNSTLSGNSARDAGAAIYNDSFGGPLTVSNSTLSANSANYGGGIYNRGTLTVSSSTLSANSANYNGGGIYSSQAPLTVSNSTLSANSANYNGGGIYNYGGTPKVSNSTLSANSATNGSGGGIFNTQGPLTVSNTIVANSTSGGDCQGATDGGYNLIEDGSCLTPGTNSISGDPLLGDLQDNGGPTKTHALLAGSTAIDRIPDTNGATAGCAAGITTDQRGEARPQGSKCEIGAYEVVGIPPVVTVPGPITSEASAPYGAVVTFNASAEDDVDGPVDVTCTPASGSLFPIGTTTVTCAAKDAAGNKGTAAFVVTVQDTTPPNITVPPDMTVEATSLNGAVVNYFAYASDLGSPLIPTCDPKSGSTFAIGTTTVTCTAKDAAGNTASASFKVTVQDTTAPTVVGTSPTNNGTMLNRSNNVTASFSEDVKNVNTTTFKLAQVIVSKRGVESGVTLPVSATVTPTSGTVAKGGLATLNPGKDLLKGSTYRATLTNGVTDTAGNPLATYSWTFKAN